MTVESFLSMVAAAVAVWDGDTAGTPGTIDEGMCVYESAELLRIVLIHSC